MTIPNGMTRQDQVVVMARGRGLRMGRPKPGLSLPRDDRTFLARILDLYHGAGLPVIVVTAADDHLSCHEAAQGRPLKLIDGPDSGDTALTLLTARRQMVSDTLPVTHWWAHPVDLPLVSPATLKCLQAISVGDAGRIVRPVHDEQIGHPVILPDGVLEDLEVNQDWHAAPLRHFLEHWITSGLGAPVMTVPVTDPGVAHDFDSPEDLASWNPVDHPEDERAP